MTEESHAYTKPVYGGNMSDYLSDQFQMDLDALEHAEAGRKDFEPSRHFHAVCYNRFPGPLAVIPPERLFTFTATFSMSFLLNQVMHAHFPEAHHEFQERFRPPFVGLTLGACITQPPWWLLEHSRAVWKDKELPVPFEVIADGFLDWHGGRFWNWSSGPRWRDVLEKMRLDPDVDVGTFGRRFACLVGFIAQGRYDKPPLSIRVPAALVEGIGGYRAYVVGADGEEAVVSMREAAERGLI